MKRIEEYLQKKFTQSPIYDLDDIIDNKPKFLVLLTVFYSLNGMLSIINNSYFDFNHMAEKLRADMQEYYDYIKDTLARMIYEYTYLACFGELRYMKEKIKNSNITIESNHFGLTKRTPERVAYINYCKNAYKYSRHSIEQVSRVLFGEFVWEESYGGEAWVDVINTVKFYGNMPNEIYIDHCVDTQHNTGCYLNKGCNIFSRSFYGVQELLDDKGTQEIWVFIRTYMKNLDTKTLKLVYRFANLISEVFNRKSFLNKIYYETLTSDEFEEIQKIREFMKSYRLSRAQEIFTYYIPREVMQYLISEKVKFNNLEIFKLSLFEPQEFGDEDMAKFITIKYYNSIDDSYGGFSKEETIEVNLRDFIVNPAKYPKIVEELNSVNDLNERR